MYIIYFCLAFLFALCQTANGNDQMWAYIDGAKTQDQLGVYPMKLGHNVDGVTYWPGSRTMGSSTIDQTTWKSYHFGGHGYSNMNTWGWPDAEHLSEMWVFDPATWKWWLQSENDKCGTSPSHMGGMQCDDHSHPAGRLGATSVMNQQNGWIYVYGGKGYTKKCEGGVGILDDMWAYDSWNTNGGNQWHYLGGTWTLDSMAMYPATAGMAGSVLYHPGSRFSHSGVFYQRSKQMVLFGGFGQGTSDMGNRNDLWVYETNAMTWQHVGGSQDVGDCGNYDTSAGALWPSSRSGHSVAVSEWSRHMYMFGGNGQSKNSCDTECGRLNELWVLDLQSWKWMLMGGSDDLDNAGTTTWPSARAWHSMVMDGRNAVIFGGTAKDGMLSNQVWSFADTDANVNKEWKMIGGTTAYMPLAVYPDTAGADPSADIWPGARVGMGAVMVSDKMMIFSGIGVNSTDTDTEDHVGRYNDVWIMSGPAGCDNSMCNSNAWCHEGLTDYDCVCNDGYKGDGMTCSVDTGVEECVGCDCPAIHLPNGEVHVNGNNDIGDMATFKCDDGYYLDLSLSLDDMATCVSSSAGGSAGEWSQATPSCIAVECSLPSIADGSFTIDGSGAGQTGEVVTYTCEEGYLLTGSSTVTCVGGSGAVATWHMNQPTCEKQTCPSDTIANGQVVVSGMGMTGDTGTYSCNSNYELSVAFGNQIRWCLGTEWSGTKPKCEEIDPENICGNDGSTEKKHCPVVKEEIVNGFVLIGDDQISYSCKPGYTLSGMSVRTCNKNSDNWVWTGTEPVCNVNLCPTLNTNDANLVMSPAAAKNTREPGTEVSYKCKAGFEAVYSLNAGRSRRCVGGSPSSVWTGSEPQCVDLSQSTLDQQTIQKVEQAANQYKTKFMALSSTTGGSGTEVGMFALQGDFIIMDFSFVGAVVGLLLVCFCCTSCIKKYRRKKHMQYAQNIHLMQGMS